MTSRTGVPSTARTRSPTRRPARRAAPGSRDATTPPGAATSGPAADGLYGVDHPSNLSIRRGRARSDADDLRAGKPVDHEFIRRLNVMRAGIPLAADLGETGRVARVVPADDHDH